MKSRVEAGRAVAYYASGLLDRAHAEESADARQRSLSLAEFMIPIVKGGSSEMGIEVTSLGIQVHGGMGVSDDTPIARFFTLNRFVRIADGPDEVHMSQLGKQKIKEYVAMNER